MTNDVELVIAQALLELCQNRKLIIENSGKKK